MARTGKKVAEKSPAARLAQASREAIMHRRHAAATDYITDPDKRSVEYWASRYKARGVVPKTLHTWATNDNWIDRRRQFWAEIERRVFEARAEQIVVARLRELEHLTASRMYLDEYLMPLRDKKTGDVLRYESGQAEGLPKFALELPKMDRFIHAYVKLDEAIMRKRGEIVDLRDSDTPTEEGALTGEPEAIMLPANTGFSREELRAMSRVIVRARQPELEQQPVVGILAEGTKADMAKEKSHADAGADLSSERKGSEKDLE